MKWFWYEGGYGLSAASSFPQPQADYALFLLQLPLKGSEVCGLPESLPLDACKSRSFWLVKDQALDSLDTGCCHFARLYLVTCACIDVNTHQ